MAFGFGREDPLKLKKKKINFEVAVFEVFSVIIFSSVMFWVEIF